MINVNIRNKTNFEEIQEEIQEKYEKWCEQQNKKGKYTRYELFLLDLFYKFNEKQSHHFLIMENYDKNQTFEDYIIKSIISRNIKDKEIKNLKN